MCALFFDFICPPHHHHHHTHATTAVAAASHAGTQLERAEKTIDLVRAEKVGADDARAEAADRAKRADAELKLRKEEVVTLKTMIDTQVQY